MILRNANRLAGMAVIVCASLGCRNRAYTEVYVDNMAAEIRTLEDQLFQYDHEYRALEQELESLREENDRLKQSGQLPPSVHKGDITHGIQGQELYEFRPKHEYNLAPGEIIVPAPSDSSPSDSSPSSSSPSSSSPSSGSPSSGSPSAGSPLDPSSVQPPTGGSATPKKGSILDRERLEPPSLRPDASKSPDANSTLPPPPGPAAQPGSGGVPPSGSPAPSTGIESIKPEDLVPSTIQPGTPMPPAQPVLPDKGAPITGKGTAPNQLEINLGRIEIPGQLASAPSRPGQLKPLREEVTDTRIVDLTFHGSLCRAHNFDEHPDDDGLYLVLQPKNDRGQCVPQAAELSIVVIDPAREGDAARISRWNYSASEIQSKIQPIGSSQGIHLSLPWNGPDPIADRVVVFARYTMPDGRRLMSEKEIFVTGKDHIRTVWVPRGASADLKSMQLAQPSHAQPPRINPSSVVRPASATMPIEPAPQPNR